MAFSDENNSLSLSLNYLSDNLANFVCWRKAGNAVKILGERFFFYFIHLNKVKTEIKCINLKHGIGFTIDIICAISEQIFTDMHMTPMLGLLCIKEFKYG